MVPRSLDLRELISLFLSLSCVVRSVIALVSWLIVVRSADIAVAILARASVAASFSAWRVVAVSIAALAPWYPSD